MEGISVAHIDRKSSIEREPRALRMDQFHFAREEALYVLKTRSMEEAMNIFTEGLKPVGSAVGLKTGTLGMVLSDEIEFGFMEDNLELSCDIATSPF
uniref:Uncharacterized protein n=1 Tax=Cannabis sativa TaxID=3483 RepID=A0A803PJ87_CANSA